MSGEIPQGIKTIWELLPAAPYTYPSGIKETDKGFIRYAYDSTNFPNLLIIDPISDSDGNMIMPGYYQLILAYDRKTLVLTQTGKLVATFPVFKYEEDPNMGKQVMDARALKAERKAQKAKVKEDKNRSKKCLDPIVKPIYMKASIQYDIEGGYYLIKYEREGIKAWGAIKE